VWAGIKLVDGVPSWASNNQKVTEIPMWLVEKTDVISLFTANASITLRANKRYVFYYNLEMGE